MHLVPPAAAYFFMHLSRQKVAFVVPSANQGWKQAHPLPTYAQVLLHFAKNFSFSRRSMPLNRSPTVTPFNCVHCLSCMLCAGWRYARTCVPCRSAPLASSQRRASAPQSCSCMRLASSRCLPGTSSWLRMRYKSTTR